MNRPPLSAIRTVARLLEDNQEDPLVDGTADHPDAEPVDVPEDADASEEEDPGAEADQVAAEMTPAQAKLVQDNMGLVVTIAQSFSNIANLGSSSRGKERDVTFDDVLAEAKVALIKAALRYKPEHASGRPFGSYAANMIRLHLRYIYKKHKRYVSKQDATLDSADEEGEEEEEVGDEDVVSRGDGTPDHHRGTADSVMNAENMRILHWLADQLENPIDKDIFMSALAGDTTNNTLGEKYGLGPKAIGMRRARLMPRVLDKLKGLGITKSSDLLGEADGFLGDPDPTRALFRFMENLKPEQSVKMYQLLKEGKERAAAAKKSKART